MRWVARVRRWLLMVAALPGLLASGAAQAWNGHALCTWQALQPLAELAPLRVRAESLESFLAAQAAPLERVLARRAFASGHDYWGWRFAGWAMHYVQDLTQPFHASILPGVGAARMVGINVAAMAGWQRPKSEAITLVSNRHEVVESYQYQRMARAYQEQRMDDAMLAALRDGSQDREHWQYRLADTRAMVSREAFDAAQALDAQLEKSFPARYTADPAVELRSETDKLDMVALARQHSGPEHVLLERQVAALLKRLGLHTRSLVRELLGPTATPPPRP